jgi:DNA-binding transcriptional regulator YiaG
MKHRNFKGVSPGFADCLNSYTKTCTMNLMERRARRKRRWNKEEVRSLRQHLKLTQVKLAEELGTRQQTISEWETGMYQPRGASATLLSMIAERSGFTYGATEEDHK